MNGQRWAKGGQTSLSMQRRYEHVKNRYRDSVVATTCDSSRFRSSSGQKRNRLLLAAIQRAFDKAASLGTPICSCLDLPWRTGRLCHGLGVTQHLGQVWSRGGLRGEAAAAGLQVVGIFSPRQGLSVFSDNWVVLLEKSNGPKGAPQA
jgi:hypothetical protein